MITLYDFQARAVEALRANIRAGVRNQVLCAPTGAGKTVLASYLLHECHSKGRRGIFVADRVSLINQTSRTFDSHDIPHGVIQSDHWRWRPWERIQIASPQTLARRKWPGDLDMIVVDECHSSYATTIKRIDKRDTVVIGLTATPFTRGLGRHYERVVTAEATNTLITDGYLCPFVVYAGRAPDMRGAKVVAGEWTDEECESRSLPIVGDVVAEYLDKAAGRKFIAFGSTVAHCEEMQRQCLAAGIQTGLYTYRGTGEERAEMVEEFRQPDSYLTGLLSVSALSKGFDVPDVECIIIARPLRKSLTEQLQMIGRGLRRDPLKPDKTCIVLDHADNSSRFWGAMLDFFEHGATELDDGKPKPKTKQERKAPEPRKCPRCKHLHNPRPTCPQCGHEYPRKAVAHVNGTLVELGAATGATMADKRRFYGELRTLAYTRGYSDGWCAHTYRERYGVWPQTLKDAPMEAVSQETYRWVQHRLIAHARSKRRR